MFCNKCGNEVGNNAKFCPKCGAEFQIVGKGAVEITQKKAGTNRRKSILILAGICIVVLLVGFVALLNRDGVVVVDGIRYECDKDSETAWVLGPKDRFGIAGDLVIPAIVKKGFQEYQVVSIRYEAFKDCENLTSIDLPDGLTSIGDDTFIGCSSLISIDLPEGVTTTGHGAFQGCSSLTNIALPDGLTSIEEYAFSGCSSLTSIDLPDGLTFIGEYAFKDCSSLTSIDLPDGLTSIQKYTFLGCSSLTSIDMPEKLDTIWDGAFADCSNLKSIELPDSFRSMHTSAFNGWKGTIKMSIWLYNNTPNIEQYRKKYFTDCEYEIVNDYNEETQNTDSDEITPINANDEEITPGPVDNSGEESTFLFSELSRYRFDFLSGGGAWQTSLNINKDGTFRGSYFDSDIGDTGKGYPNGTMYSSVFEGKFTRPKKVNDYTYSMSIESIKLEQEVGREEIIDGIRYIYSEPYGLDGAKEIYIYTPQAPIKELPESYRSWVSYMDLNEVTDEHLSFYGLYNVETEEGFSGHVIDEIGSDNSDVDITAELAEIEIQYDEMNNRLINEELNQSEMNSLAKDIFILWDDEINKVWGYLKESLDKDEMDRLTGEQKEWITMKENETEKAGFEYEGGR